MRRTTRVLLGPAVAVLACSAPDPSREVDLLTRAWVEVTLVDSKVPPDPISEEGRAPACHLELELGGTKVLSETISPQGPRPPYSVDSTFRVAAPPGEHSAAVYYAGCRTFRGQFDSREAHLPISVQLGHVTRLRFDGSRLEAHSPVALRLEEIR